MKQQVQQHFGFLKTTLLGGVVFLLPLAVVGWLLAYAGQIIYGIYASAKEYVDEHKEVQAYTELDSGTYLIIAGVTLAVLIGLCFISGMIARWSLGRWFTRSAERYLLMLFPRYAVFKDQLTGNLGSASLKPVLAKVAGTTRIGMEVERAADGRVTVYLPSSPDPWSGTVAIVEPTDVTPLRGEFPDVMATFEQLGRGSSKFVDRS